MRGIGLMIAISFTAACGGPDAEPSSNNFAERQEDIAAANNSAPAAPVEPANETDAVATIENAQVAAASPCLMQDGNRLQAPAIRAVGTEPFWGARVEGRCVTYSTPENQQGVRVWTHYAAGADGRATWTGQMNGKKFELRVRPEPGCSDGMSDQRYPMAVELTVNGEERRGCAIPL